MDTSFNSASDTAFRNYAAAQAQGSAQAVSVSTQDLFSSELAQVEAQNRARYSAAESSTAPNMSLTPANAAQGLPVKRGEAQKTETGSTPSAATAKDSYAAASEPKIARSWRMESADQATEVQEDATLSWGDFLDLVNPLQHIPVLNSFYRDATGDTIKPGVQIAGDIAYGAATGSLIVSAAAGIASAIYTESYGKEPAIQVAQSLFGDDTVGEPSPEAGEINVAEASSLADKKAAALEALAQSKQKQADTPTQSDLVLAALAQKGQNAGALDASGAPSSAVLEQASRSVAKTRGASGMRIGNNIHPSPTPSATSRVAALNRRAAPSGSIKPQAATLAKTTETSAQVLAQADQTASQTKAAAQIATAQGQAAAVSPPEDSAALVSMMQQQAQAKASGQDLPPALVQDMMIMALDKYQTSSALGTTGAQTSVQ